MKQSCTLSNPLEVVQILNYRLKMFLSDEARVHQTLNLFLHQSYNWRGISSVMVVRTLPRLASAYLCTFLEQLSMDICVCVTDMLSLSS